ncbi:MAG TPA: hypothetical protein VKK61_08305 [Tepidisphaeraceae bacterium]|nr:hypothetical protein [Tepidisphaeraceae bacterium]
MEVTIEPVSIRSRISGIFHRRATWVLMDQGIVSIGNFLTANLLGRKLPEGEFGNFGLLLETMLYFNSLQSALVIYPLTVKGATGDRENLGRLATLSILFSFLLLPVLGFGMGFSIQRALNNWYIVFPGIAAMLLWQLQETMRRGLMSDLRFADTLIGDFISYPGQAIIIFCLAHYTTVTLDRAFLIIGATSALATCIQGWQIGLKPVELHMLKSVGIEFWRLGRWMVLSASSTLVSTLAYWWTLKWRFGPETCGVFTAIAQLFKPANPIVSSMCGLIVPAVARSSVEGGSHAASRTATKYILFGAMLIFPYVIVLLLFPTTALRLFYGNKPYVAYGFWLRLFILNYALAYVSATAGAWLGGLGHSRWNFYAQSANLLGSVFVGVPCTYIWGVPGLIIGGLVPAGAMAITSAYFIHRAAYRKPSSH